MKHIKKHILLLLLAAFTLIPPTYSQPRPPSDHGGDNDATPRPAPIGSGLFILLVLGAGYGAARVIQHRKTHL